MKNVQKHIVVWWEALVHPDNAGRLVLGVEEASGFNRFLIIGVTLLYAFYGFSMGLFRGFYPAVISGLKMPFLYLVTLLICFPAFYVLNCTVGPRLKLMHCFRLLLLVMSTNAAALSSYVFFSFFFTLTTSIKGYAFLILMHIAVFGLSGIVSVFVIGLIFRATAAQMGKKLHIAFIIGWAILYAFVGTQVSWVLRPWIGSWDLPYTPFRKIGGSFIEAFWNLLF